MGPLNINSCLKLLLMKLNVGSVFLSYLLITTNSEGLNVLLMAYFSKLFHFSGFFSHSVFFNPPPVTVSANKRLAAHVTILDTTAIINVEAPNSKD